MNNFPGYPGGSIPRYDRYSQYNAIRFSGGAFDNLSVRNDFTFENDMNVYGNLTVRKNFIIEKDIVIMENTSISGETDITNLLKVDDLLVRNDASINNTLDVSGKVTFGDDLYVDGSTIMNKSLRVDDKARLGNITSGGFQVINYLGPGGKETSDPASAVSLLRHDGEMELRNGRSNLITLRREPNPTSALAIGPMGGFIATTFVKKDNSGTFVDNISTSFFTNDGSNNINYLRSLTTQAVSIGQNHLLVLAEEVIDGKTEYVVKGFGNNSYCQLGCLGGTDNITIVDPSTPLPRKPITDIIAIAAAKAFSVLLRSTGEVLILGNTLPGNTANYISSLNYALVAKDDGEVMPKIVQISAKNDHILLLTIDEEIISLGLNNSGRLGRTVYDNTSIEQTYVTDSNGNRITNVAYVEAGGRHSLYITNDALVYGFGYNANRQLKDNATTQYNNPVLISDDFAPNEQIIDIAAGGFHSLFITYNYDDPHVPTYLYTAGSNYNGQIFDNSTGSDISVNPIAKTAIQRPFIAFAGRDTSVVVNIAGVPYGYGTSITAIPFSQLLINYGYYTINVDTLINANLTAMGDVVLNTDVSNLTYNRGKMIVDGEVGLNRTLDVSGVTSLYDRLDVSGATRMFDTLHVWKHTTCEDDVSMNQNVDITNNLNVGGNTDIDGYTHIQGTLDVCGNVVLNTDGTNNTRIKGSLDVEQATRLASTLTVTGASNLNNALTVTGASNLNNALTVTGASNLNNTLTVDGATDLNSTLTVDGATDLNSTLTVDGATDLNSTLTVDGATDFNNNVNIDGTTTMNQKAFITSGGLEVSGNSDFNNSVNIDGTTTMNNKLTITSTGTDGLAVTGNADFNNNVNIDGTTTMNDKVTITSTGTDGLSVTGDALFNNDVSINQKLDVTDHALFRDDVSINGTLQVGTNSLVITQNGISHTGNEFYLNTDGLYTDGDINLHGDISIGGHISLSGNIDMSGRLDIRGVDIVSRIDSCLNNLQTTISGDINTKINDLSSNVNSSLIALDSSLNTLSSKVDSSFSAVNGSISSINQTLDDAGLTGDGGGALAETYATIDGSSNNFFSVKDTTSTTDGNYALNRDSADIRYLKLSGGSLSGDLKFTENSGSEKITLFTSTSNNKTYGIGFQDYTTYFRTQNSFAFFKGGEHNNGKFNAGGGTVVMVIDDNGDVGIGTTSPAATLDVSGTAKAITFNENGTNLSSKYAAIGGVSTQNFNAKALYLANNQSIFFGSNLRIYSNSSNDGIQFWNVLNIQNRNIKFNLNSHGYTHIALECEGGGIRVHAEGANGYTMDTGNIAPMIVGRFGQGYYIEKDGNNYQWKHLFRTKTSSGNSYVDQLVIRSNGKVGIGTTSPAYTLDVGGTANANTLQIKDTYIDTTIAPNFTTINTDAINIISAEYLSTNEDISDGGITIDLTHSNFPNYVSVSTSSDNPLNFTYRNIEFNITSGVVSSDFTYFELHASSTNNATAQISSSAIITKIYIQNYQYFTASTNMTITDLNTGNIIYTYSTSDSPGYININSRSIQINITHSATGTVKLHIQKMLLNDFIIDDLTIGTDVTPFGLSQDNNSATKYIYCSEMGTPTGIILYHAGSSGDEEVTGIVISPTDPNGYFTDGNLNIYAYRSLSSGYATVALYNDDYTVISTNTYYSGYGTIAINDTTYVKYIVLRLRLNEVTSTSYTHYIAIRNASTIKIKQIDYTHSVGCTFSPIHIGATDAKLQLNMFNDTNTLSPVYITSTPEITNFTGQHHNYSVNENIDADLKGFIVISTGTYKNQMDNCNECNKYKVTINESLPIVDLSKKSNDKKVFGVISDKDDNSETKEIKYGYISGYKQVHSLDRPLTINSLGEGAIWVCNVNGSIENGDYITSSPIPGLGMIQNDDLLHNYTVAKSTMDCEFVGEQVPRKKLCQTPVMIEKTELKLIQQTQQKQAQMLDESGNIVIDESGNPVMEYVFDNSGNPVMEGVTDESGNPVMIKEKDASGNIIKVTVYDESGNPIMVQDKYPNGELKYDPVVDEQGNFIYDFIYDDSGNQLYTDKYESKYVEVFADKFVIYNDTEKTQEFYTYEFEFANGSQDQQDCIGNTYVMAFIGCTYHCG